MKIMDALKKLKLSRSVKTTTSIVILQGGVYIAKSDGFDELQEHYFTPIDQPQSWKNVIVEACEKAGVTNSSASVILGSHLYQSFQIDNPNLPKEELAGALPFLVKDLITDRIADIVADGIETINGKLQVYISQVTTLHTLIDALSPLSIQINNVTPDELLWAYSQPEDGSFMLLNHSQSADFKLLAFNNAHLHLNRSLRGITAPLTGDQANSFQMDSLALELQRSLDYLSSQLHGVSINNLFFRCDDEDDALLALELQNRLGVKVASLLVDEPRAFRSGEVLAWLALFNTPSINLFHETLKPKTDYFTLQNVMISWGVGLALSIAVVGYYQWQIYNLETTINANSLKESNYKQELATLNKKLESHKPSAAKLAAIKRLNDDIQSKKASLKVIDNFDEGMQVGYSGVMSSLTQLGKGNISLNKIYISGDKVNFAGYARTPDVIPRWVQSFDSELHLVGRTFDQLEIKTDDKGLVSFILNTKASEGNHE
ncbi:MSHA biogenesis protein MshI [Aliivibrio fischeri]|uniref:MSHA biogenesis protein MshI n=1 Tax=Aliivibrio fischeri TaxID=668 RepID=UPI0012D941E8|nr:MSHA biogenesis protein MshI [Aliivibrio fischeri]MUL03765.1 MSHA biogenesis protein MshI [Aliivibrio fischeri]